MVANLNRNRNEQKVEQETPPVLRGPAKILLALLFLGILATLLLSFSFNRSADSWQFGSDSVTPRQTIR